LFNRLDNCTYLNYSCYMLSSPVREIWFTDQILNDIHFKIGGDTAFSNFTMLSESNCKTYVILIEMNLGLLKV